jgi:hypothetical protein
MRFYVFDLGAAWIQSAMNGGIASIDETLNFRLDFANEIAT